MGFHRTNFGLPNPIDFLFSCSCRTRHTTDRQTDKRTNGQKDSQTLPSFYNVPPYGSRAGHNKLCGRRGCGRHGISPPAFINNPTAQTFIAGHGSWQRMHQPPTKFEVYFHFQHYSAGWTCLLTFWPRTWCTLLHVRLAIFPPIWVFLGRFVLDLSANTCETRHVTLRPLTLEVTALVADAVRRAPSVYEVWSS